MRKTGGLQAISSLSENPSLEELERVERGLTHLTTDAILEIGSSSDPTARRNLVRVLAVQTDFIPGKHYAGLRHLGGLGDPGKFRMLLTGATQENDPEVMAIIARCVVETYENCPDMRESIIEMVGQRGALKPLLPVEEEIYQAIIRPAT